LIGTMIEQPKGRFALTNSRVILPQEIALDKAVLIEGNKIVAVTDRDALGSEVKTIDVEGRYITPGLIDIHTHGALGHSFNEATTEAFAAITGEHARRGVTSLLVTLVSAPISELVNCFEFSRGWMRDSHSGTQVLGVHMEGPYFVAEQAGANNPNYFRSPDDGSADILLEHADVLRMLTFAPELPGALALLELLDRPVGRRRVQRRRPQRSHRAPGGDLPEILRIHLDLVRREGLVDDLRAPDPWLRDDRVPLGPQRLGVELVQEVLFSEVLAAEYDLGLAHPRGALRQRELPGRSGHGQRVRRGAVLEPPSLSRPAPGT